MNVIEGKLKTAAGKTINRKMQDDLIAQQVRKVMASIANNRSIRIDDSAWKWVKDKSSNLWLKLVGPDDGL